MILTITAEGDARAIYTEDIDLGQLGAQTIQRASHVEPTADGTWTAAIIDGPTLGPFPTRTEALAAEVAWIEANQL